MRGIRTLFSALFDEMKMNLAAWELQVNVLFRYKTCNCSCIKTRLEGKMKKMFDLKWINFLEVT